MTFKQIDTFFHIWGIFRCCLKCGISQTFKNKNQLCKSDDDESCALVGASPTPKYNPPVKGEIVVEQ